ncbi:MAG TPA: hypothetical protein VGL77_01670 [Armatimonadota bacterium]|jgi:hypothetical protein
MMSETMTQTPRAGVAGAGVPAAGAGTLFLGLWPVPEMTAMLECELAAREQTPPFLPSHTRFNTPK